MTGALTPTFDYQGQAVRTVVIDGEPWFVAADVARILGYRMASDMTRRLDSDDRGTRSVRTPSGEQDMTVINEPGLYQAVLGSQTLGARDFKRWITHTVLPEIRRTGSYNSAPALTGTELLARAILEAQEMLAAKDERIAELEPRAEVADRLLDADGDLSVADAAKSLSRAGVKVGQNRLFTLLANQYGWIYRAADHRWRVKQSAIETGWMQVIPQSHYHPRTGVLVLDPPQPRITPKGLQRILVDHGGQPALDMTTTDAGVTA